MPTPLPPLPIVEVLPELADALAHGRRVVLEAPPGAGKSTLVPLTLLDAAWRNDGRILMLEPRRIAARAVATRMAALLGETPGARVGYRTRLETRVGPATRLEVVTEGILTRMLQHDAALEGVACVVFDEFHERNLQGDLGLALALDCQRHLRADLRLLVMSATLDAEALARVLDDARFVRAPGRMFDVQTFYASASASGPSLSPASLATQRILQALDAHPGDLLAFLPGAGEIRRVTDALATALPDDRCVVLPLYGDLAAAAQDAALQADPRGRRKVIVATNIAETSLTIDGVRIVVDLGLERRQRFDPATGMSRLETLRISRASADQRRGRAGRTASGVCYRLWSETAHAALLPQAPAEILEADLAPLALELACWGVTDAAALAWLDPPPAAPLAQARELLSRLEALDGAGRVTPLGRDMAALGVHPRLRAHDAARAVARPRAAWQPDRGSAVGARSVARRDGIRRSRPAPAPRRTAGPRPAARRHGRPQRIAPPGAGRAAARAPAGPGARAAAGPCGAGRVRRGRVAARLRVPGPHRSRAGGNRGPLRVERRPRCGVRGSCGAGPLRVHRGRGAGRRRA